VARRRRRAGRLAAPRAPQLLLAAASLAGRTPALLQCLWFCLLIPVSTRRLPSLALQLPYDLNTVIFIEVLGIAYAESARQTAEPAKVRAAARARALNAALR
jgi:hypothetical protein